jgi:hypothetical protein
MPTKPYLIALSCLVATAAHAAPPASLAKARLSPSEVGPGCRPGRDYPGSLHAATSYEVPMTPPKAKDKQSFVCAGKPVALYLYEYATEQDAKDNADGLGMRLWGGPAPTDEHPDELLAAKTVLAVVSGEAREALIGPLRSRGFQPVRLGLTPGMGHDDVISRLSAELDCKPTTSDVLRAFCPAALVVGAGYQAPAEASTFLGISAAIPAGASVRATLQQNLSVSALALGGGKVLVQEIRPENDNERQQMLAVVIAMVGILKGKGGPATIGVAPDLAGFLNSLKGKVLASGHPVTQSGLGASFSAHNPSRIYKVSDPRAGDVYVVVEQTSDGGAWINLFPVRPFQAR